MGREIIFQTRKKGEDKIYFEDFLCGRYEPSVYISNLIYNKQNKLGPLADDATEEEIDNYYSINFNFYSKEIKNFKKEITEYAKEEDDDIREIEDRISDLKIARRNVTKIEDFYDFTDAINEEETEKNDIFRYANFVLEFLQKAQDIIKDEKDSDQYYFKIILSE